MVYVNNSNELYHYGVKGMRWGHRKNVYDVNAAYYNKRAAKLDARAKRSSQMASMNRAVVKNAPGMISKVNQINANYYQNKANKLTAKADKSRAMAELNSQASKQKNSSKSAQKTNNRNDFDKAYDEWTRNRQTKATNTLARSKSKGGAMAKTAVKGLVKSKVVSIGSTIAGNALTHIGAKPLGVVARAAGSVAATKALVDAGVEMYNISKK